VRRYGGKGDFVARKQGSKRGGRGGVECFVVGCVEGMGDKEGGKRAPFFLYSVESERWRFR
jgi:hypothetical protein